VPISLYVVWELDQPFLPAFPILLAGTSVVLLYGVLLRFFGMETITRPVLEEVSREVPGDADLPRRALSVRWRLLLALPAINVISGVIVSGLSADDRSLGALGIGVAMAIAVAFTISLELTYLLASSIVRPLRDLRRGTEAVAAGDLDVRVPVLGADEMGRLASGFNAMVAGLAERERLREAFGAYVDPTWPTASWRAGRRSSRARRSR
jgi:methyl-accepting chemotaxis protein